MPAKCKDREKILATGVVDIPGLPVGAIRGYLCFRCFNPAEKIFKCGGCRRAGYCSKECQKLDWSIVHKKYCKILQSVNQLEEEQYQEKRTWAEYSGYLLKTATSMKNAAPSDDNLHFIVQAQAYCASCRRTAVQLSTRKVALEPCNKCRLVFSCDTCPPSSDTHSPSVCLAYQNYGKIEEFRISFFEDTGKASPVTCTEFPRNDRKQLADSPGWYDYFVNISDKTQIKDVVRPDFSGLGDPPYCRAKYKVEDFERMRMFLVCATDNLTMPLTILSALEDISCDKPHLDIHLLGATGRECGGLANFEEMLHLVPGIKSLHVAAVGPSSWGVGPGSRVDLQCCPNCTSQGRSRSVTSYQGLYHDFARSDRYSKPDLIVLFNSGWVDGTDAESHWRPTIQLLLESGIPTLCTTYNAQEAVNEKSVMIALGAEFLVQPEKNKWCGLVPTPEFIDAEFDMWWQNSHRYIVKGRARG